MRSVSTASSIDLRYPSLHDKLRSFGGVGPGFDHLRIGLSLCILLWHSFSNSYGLNYAESLPSFPVPPLLSALLPMFFGLSGFLVMGSALRTNDAKTFLTFRILRILPALFTEIAVSALILGPLLTTLPLGKYFTDPMFFEYFGSLFGRVRFALPGLFSDNPAPNLVNFALWTVGPEILCYVVMLALMISGLYKNRNAVLVATIAYGAVCIASGIIHPPTHIAEVLPARILIFAFLIGATIYHFREAIPYSLGYAVISFLIATLLVYAGQRMDLEFFSYLAVPAYIYVVAVVGLTDLPKIPLLSSGDYSYGVYIYGFPIQQTVAHFLPQHREWWVNFGSSLPVTLFVAAMSWHFIEKPFLSLRKRFNRTDGEQSFSADNRALMFLAAYALFLIYVNDVFPLKLAIKTTLDFLGLRSMAVT
jgi:peptidoglycan/LPS O-acetylase OafA/YrhL